MKLQLRYLNAVQLSAMVVLLFAQLPATDATRGKIPTFGSRVDLVLVLVIVNSANGLAPSV
jgi:hypothetical protein